MDDLKAAAAEKMPNGVRDFYNSGSTDQITVHENQSAYLKYRLRPRVLVDVFKVDTTTVVFGRRIDFPLSIAPAGIQAMAHPDGELATSRAAAGRNINMSISSFSNYSVEDVRKAGLGVGPIEHTMQIYTMQDRQRQQRIIRRARAAGCRAIFLTADSPVLGIRYNEHRSDFRTPAGLDFPNLELLSRDILANSHADGFDGFNSASHSWAKEIPWLREMGMEIWVKGVLTSEDVLLAREYGCDGVIVSNHGGRQLDGTPATIDVLAECVQAAGGQIRVHVDGGIRSGTDIFKAIALGAECCWIGRPTIWGLAYDGEAGVTLMLDMLYKEFQRCMQLCGCKTVADISKAALGIVRKNGPLARL
ncbi:(S)-2-hydroxy-acid oxidase [Myriangium duriaei CBS 260.36]|uniref:Oxidase FUB9 n=1 Tax=Myriangium duriaei CBS 260.36 TaxID=1168546 RepID=A0A9P4IUN1_9PEZI|nr:(S)-2-hydroxy-acid oxidase [Myriangium duriaei CBS 260.36]